MHEGRILASDAPELLQERLNARGRVTAEIEAAEDELRDFWRQHPQVEQVEIAAVSGAYLRCTLTPVSGQDIRPVIFEVARQRNWKLRELSRTRPTLEDVFVHLTKPLDEEDL
jgi:ABC-type multidrug transport system ATPase subunit